MDAHKLFEASAPSTSDHDYRGERYAAWRSHGGEDGFATAVANAPWRIRQHVGPSPLYGANGINWGPDGRLCVAQGAGNRVSALDAAGGFETLIAFGSPVAAPDDLVFDSAGEMFITDVEGGSVWRRSPDGRLGLVAGDLPSANGIAIRADRLYVNECREGGRLLELGRHGGGARLILHDLAAPNGMAFGPDGRLYFPLVFKGEVWAVDVEGGRAERILDGLAIASAVKISSAGVLAVTSSATGIITRFDLASRKRTEIQAERGFDNLLFDRDDRLFVSYFSDGGIGQVSEDGHERLLAPRGLIAPTAIAFGPDSAMFIADSALKTVRQDRSLRTVATYTDPGFPGKLKGLSSHPDCRLAATTAGGDVALYDPRSGVFEVIASGLNQPAGIACALDGKTVVAESGAGRVMQVGRQAGARVLAEGLGAPNGVALSPSGRCFVSDGRGGRVFELSDGGRRIVAEGLAFAGGVAASESHLFVLDPAAQALTAVDLASGRSATIVRGLPVRPPPAVAEHASEDAGEGAGGVAHAAGGSGADPDAVLAKATAASVYHVGIAWDRRTGAVYVPTDADGAVLAISPAA